MKLWSNYLQHRGNQRISLYKASLQSIQKCAKMTVSQTLSAQPPPIPSLPHVNIWYKKVRLAKPAMPRKEEMLQFQPEPPSYGCRPIFLRPQLQPVQRDRQLCFLQWWVLTSSDQLFSHFLWLSWKQVQDPGSNKSNGCLKQAWRKMPTLDHPREETKQK